MVQAHDPPPSILAPAPERDALLRTIETLERQRHVLGEAAINVALAPLRAKLAALDGRTGKPAPLPARTSERKVVTVLFADIAGFTEMSERLDSERVVEIVNALFDRLVPVLERYGGTIDKFIGDEVMAVFGAPHAAEHHVEHALRAALDMFTALAAYNRDRNLALGLHVGINSGSVVAGDVGSQERRDYSVTGDTVNVAARLEGAAEAGQILVGPSTYRHAVQAFEFDELPALALKGKSRPTPVYRLVGVKRRRTRAPALAAGVKLAFSGRANELQSLIARLGDATTAPGGVVGIVAEPGVGKSRLLAEFHDRADAGIRWLEANGDEYRSEVSYAAVREVIDGVVGLADADDDGDVGSAYCDYLDALAGEHSTDIRPYLFRLRGLALDPRSEAMLAELAPDVLRQRMTEAVAELLASATTKRRTVLSIEDLHWADASSISLIRGLAGHPLLDNLLIVFTTRPDPGLAREWIEQLRAMGDDFVIELSPLSDEVIGQLLNEAFDGADASRALGEAIRAKAQGNPFYLVSFLRSLIDEGVAALRDGRLCVTGGVNQLTVPETLHAAVGSRIDRLPPRAKQVLRWASVVGSVVTPDDVARISRVEIDSADVDLPLSLLEERQLLTTDAEGRLRFVHAVVRDVAYDGMLERDRRRLHGIVARFLEPETSATSEADVALLAWHLERAGDRPAASMRYEQASRLAAKAFANREEMQYLESALALSDGGDTGRVRDLVERLGDVLQVSGRFAEAADRFESIRDTALEETLDAVRIVRKIAKTWTSRQRFGEANDAIATARAMLERVDAGSGDAWWRAHFALELSAMWSIYMQARIAEFAELVSRLGPQVEKHATIGERGLFHRNVALLQLRQQRYRPDAAVVALAACAVDELRNAGDTREICLATFSHAFAQLWRGEVVKAYENLQQVLSETTRLGDAERNMLSLTYLAVAARMLHDVDRAEAFAHAGMSASRRNGSRHYEGVGHANLAWVSWRRGDGPAADQHVVRAREMAVLPGYPFIWLYAMVGVARALEQSDVATATEHVRSMSGSQQLLQGGVQDALEAAAATPDAATIASLLEVAERVGYL
jgi:class 3 adenylate cyclase/tetratricopeptide (TPR) repeat protein